MPWVESPFFEEILAAKNLTDGEVKLVKEYNKNGYVVIPGLLPSELIDSVKQDAEEKWNTAVFPKTIQRDAARIQDFWRVSPFARELAVYKPLLNILALFYGRPAVPFQTLNFRVGSQQRAHSDTIHFSSLPAKFMCGVWVALEDITEENGPVFYYPGSQRLPEYNFSHIRGTAGATTYGNYKEYEDFIEKIVEVNKLEKKKFLAKKGDLLIWSSNIIHGGSPVTKQGATRWSQVTHYFFEDCYYYTPMLSNMVTGEFDIRYRLDNIITGKRVKQSYNGVKLNYLRTGKKLFTFIGNFKVPKLFAKF